MTRPNDHSMPADIERALQQLTRDRAFELVRLLVDTPSPTGREHEVGRRLASWLRDRGIEADAPTDGSAPARVVVGAQADGRPRLLLYGQLDSAFSGDDDDRPLLGADRDAAEFLPRATQDGEWIRGLGAENPKGYLAASVLALEALTAVGRPRNLQLVGGFCGQAMPALERPGSPQTSSTGAMGFGVGCRSMMAALAPVQQAIVAKPGFAAGHDEVGIAVFTVTVHGRLGYTGIRTGAAGENTVAAAARFVTALEDWFVGYTDRHTTATTRPRGAVVAVHGGDPGRPAFWPQAAELTVDLRLPPGSEVEEIAAEFRAQVAGIARQLGVGADVDLRFGIAGRRTSPDAPVVRAAVRAWESMQGTRHQPRSGTSGYTDASTLRSLGIDTVRMGMPRADGPAPRFSMGAVHLPSLLVLAEWIVRTVVELDGDAATGTPHRPTSTQELEP